MGDHLQVAWATCGDSGQISQTGAALEGRDAELIGNKGGPAVAIRYLAVFTGAVTLSGVDKDGKRGSIRVTVR